ncbi:unnamed protein product [Owenia fusiformis]|uniref:Major facilitator superfamily (MFS) profile domain-containing protein n=1 Tax=Owenia fusiformis TaxID=6347 RepID=A0A8S4N1X9_OWEFU|nr:unnamed protein product [Owenia fusiformis]
MSVSSEDKKLRLDKDDSTPGKYWGRDEKRLWGASLFISCASLYTTRSVMPMSIVSVAKDVHWDKVQKGTVLSAFFWGYCMTQVLGGYLSDRIGGDIVLIVSATGWALITFWTPFIIKLSSDQHTAMVLVVISRVLLGCFQGVHFPSVTSIVCRKVNDQERSLIYSFITSGSQLGILICGSVGSILLERFGWSSVFYVSGCAGICWVFFLKYYLVAQQRKKQIVLSMKDNIVAGEKSHTDSGAVPWLLFFRKPPFWAIIVAHFCHTNAFFILFSWLPTYFHDNFPDAKGWVFNVVPWIVTIPSAILGGHLADLLIRKGYSVTFTRKFLETICVLGMNFGMLSVTHCDNIHSAVVCMMITTAASTFHISSCNLNAGDIAPEYSGSVFGVMNMAGAIPGFIGVYIAGYILETTKSWAAVFNQTAVVTTIGWLTFMIFGSGKKIV